MASASGESQGCALASYELGLMKQLTLLLDGESRRWQACGRD